MCLLTHVSRSPNPLLNTLSESIFQKREPEERRVCYIYRERERERERERRSRLLAGLRRQQRWLNGPNDGGFN
ncbi:hypothetical protein HanIR_Chr14g0690341 [Helianthus annuus]|nr:hypothetical protein HanIR_Chr14g0690341 [Helianthus annuus]